MLLEFVFLTEPMARYKAAVIIYGHGYVAVAVKCHDVSTFDIVFLHKNYR